MLRSRLDRCQVSLAGFKPFALRVGSAYGDIPPRLCISYLTSIRSPFEARMKWRDRLGMDTELVERDYADWGG